MDTSDAITRASRRSSPRAIVAAGLGNAFEWYDFTVYALFALYFAKAFFPGGDGTGSLIEAFLAFGVGFVVRPLGAILLGLYGDLAGRKAVLTLTIGLMALGTGLIAVAPSYASIGIGAPILLLAARVLQGLSAGGEMGGAAAFLVELAPPGRRGEYASWLQASMAGSNIIGALVAFAVTAGLSRAQLETFGWRLPFAIGLLIAPIGYWLRRGIPEAPAPGGAGARTRRGLGPVRELVTQHPGALLRGLGLSILLTVSSYTLVIFMPTYVQRAFGYAPSQAFAASLIANALMVGACVLAGIVSDRIGRRAVLTAAAVWVVVLVHPMIWLMGARRDTAVLALAQCILCLGVGAFVGVAPSAVAEAFPTSARATGVSIVYNLAVTLFSGFAPAALAWLTARGGVHAPGWYVMFAALLAAPAILALPPGAPGPLDPDILDPAPSTLDL